VRRELDHLSERCADCTAPNVARQGCNAAFACTMKRTIISIPLAGRMADPQELGPYKVANLQEVKWLTDRQRGSQV
jgi:hypothetical protein